MHFHSSNSPSRWALAGLAISCLLMMANIATAAQYSPTLATGVVVPERSVTIAALMVGRIHQVNVEEGASVTGGALLVVLVDAELQADLASSKASLALAKAELLHSRRRATRFQKLFKAKSVSREQFEEEQFKLASALARVDSAKASTAKAEALLSEAYIRAPFDGVVTQKFCEVGQVTQPGERLLVLEDQSRLKLKVKLKETDLQRLKPNQPVMIQVGSPKSEPILATVTKIVPSADSQTHAFTIEINLPAIEGVYPGMFGKLHLLETDQ